MNEALSLLFVELTASDEGSRRLDTLIARTLFGWHVWKSKHGYWNLERPDSWPLEWLSDIGRPHTLAGRHEDHVYDPQTGAKLPPEREPDDYAEDIGAPQWTACLDDALAMTERFLPDAQWCVQKQRDGCGNGFFAYVMWIDKTREPGSQHVDYRATAKTPALAICLATIRAMQAKHDLSEERREQDE